jgi:hypothetical protein
MSDRCPFPNGGPPLNQDIAGTGVRISFYLQTLFLGEHRLTTLPVDFSLHLSLSVREIAQYRGNQWLLVHPDRDEYCHGGFCPHLGITTQHRNKFSRVRPYPPLGSLTHVLSLVVSLSSISSTCHGSPSSSLYLPAIAFPKQSASQEMSEWSNSFPSCKAIPSLLLL